MSFLSADKEKKILIILPNLKIGGAEKLHINLAEEWTRKGCKVEFVLMKKEGEYLKNISRNIVIKPINVDKIRHVLFPLLRYIQKSNPDYIISAMWPLTSVSILAWMFSGRNGKLFVSDHINLTQELNNIKFPIFLASLIIRLTYRYSSGIIAVSLGVKEDIVKMSKLSKERIKLIYNPVASGKTYKIATNLERHKLWGYSSEFNVVSVGSFKKQKDYCTLIRAFSLIQNEVNGKLVILGDGPQRGEMENLITKLGMKKYILLPGFTVNPYPWYLSADLFVLSSIYEGFGNVIVEALECGLPVVSTDCQSGPREILENGKYGTLVSVGDIQAIANAIKNHVGKKFNNKKFIERALDFSIPGISDEYLKYFDGDL